MNMNVTLSLGPLVSLIAGILILMVPRLLNYIVAIYLIIIGLIGLFGGSNLRILYSRAGRSAGRVRHRGAMADFRCPDRKSLAPATPYSMPNADF
jgi:hypothetical protein